MRPAPAKIRISLLLLALGIACAVSPLLAKKKDIRVASSLDEQKRAVHALNRLTFGPRPGDVQRVMVMGVDRWIDQQLHPDKINDSALAPRLASFRTLRMSSHEIAENFPDGQMVKQVMDGKKSMPSDPAKRAVYQVQIARQEEKRFEKQAQKNDRQTEEAATVPAHSPAAMEAEGGNAPAMTASNTAPAMDSAATMSSDAGTMTNSPALGTEKTPEAIGNATSLAKETPSLEIPPVNDPGAKLREARLYADLKVQQLIDQPPDQRYKSVLAMNADEQLAFADSLRGGKGQEFVAGMDPKQKETLLAMNNPQGVITDELVQAKLLRAVYSERQLEEVMTDFWFNHFNVYVGKGPDRQFVTGYEQDVIRPHALGKFEDLLLATAKSPAMLFYLDNWLSVGPDSMQALGIPAHPGRYPRYPRPNPKRKKSGLNENYGRELMELHTLSVNGGYSQQDVIEAAKVFTGWTIDKPNEGGGFKYDPRTHEPGPKFVMGHRIKPKGEDEGRELLHLLAINPRTAQFICTKLAQRFVSDEPPQPLIDRMAKTYLKKKGDIREVLATLFHSPEFWSDETYRAKVKTPLEFVASAVRATGADVEDALPLTRQLNNMGMPLYGAQPPTGYSMKAEAWVSSSALLNRMNFALALTTGKVKGVKVDSVQLAGNAPASDTALALTAMESSLLAGQVSKQTHDSIEDQIEQARKKNAPAISEMANKKQGASKPPAVAKPPDTGTIAGLLLGSPEFQRR
jgi:uncharacterized protein (DUF1800 family)